MDPLLALFADGTTTVGEAGALAGGASLLLNCGVVIWLCLKKLPSEAEEREKERVAESKAREIVETARASERAAYITAMELQRTEFIRTIQSERAEFMASQKEERKAFADELRAQRADLLAAHKEIRSGMSELSAQVVGKLEGFGKLLEQVHAT